MSSTSRRSRRSCIERSLAISPASSVIGASSRSRAHCCPENIRYGLYCCSGARISMTPPLTFYAGPDLAQHRFALVALARCLLFQSGHGRALRQRRLDILKRDATRLQQHQQMKQQVPAFSDQMATIVLDRGDHGFHRFLAELFGAMLRTLVQQLAGIGRLSYRSRAGIDGGGEIVNRETRHQLNSGASKNGRQRTHLALL